MRSINRLGRIAIIAGVLCAPLFASAQSDKLPAKLHPQTHQVHKGSKQPSHEKHERYGKITERLYHPRRD